MRWHNNKLKAGGSATANDTIWILERHGQPKFSYQPTDYGYTYYIRQGSSSNKYLSQKVERYGDDIWNGEVRTKKKWRIKTDGRDYHFDTIPNTNDIKDKHLWIIAKNTE